MTAKSANEKLLSLTIQYMVSQAFFTAARLKVADLLAAGDAASDDLAARLGMHPGAFYRMLRLLASHGLFEELPGRRFALNDVAHYLRSDVEHSYLDYALMIGQSYPTSAQFDAGIASGESLFKLHHGQEIFAYIGDHPELGPVFDRAMESLHGIETAAFLEVVDLSDARSFADIGGGNGDVIAQVLRAHAQLEGILFDLPAVVTRTRETFAASGLDARCRCVAGSFFEAIPVAADVYFLRHILHDWNDDQCVSILRNLAAVAASTSRVLVGECLIEPPNVPGIAKHMDMVMMQFTSGYERTLEEFAALFDVAGLVMTDVTPTASMISVIEARPRAA